jgi:very-short-patch-repair endonuclease
MYKNSVSLEVFKKMSHVHLEYQIGLQTWKILGIPEPVHNHRFHPVRRWKIDYAWPDQKLAVEIEGGHRSRPVVCHHCNTQVMQRSKAGKMVPVKIGGAHTSTRYTGDLEKYNTLAMMGWVLLRYLPGKENYSEICDTYRAIISRPG